MKSPIGKGKVEMMRVTTREKKRGGGFLMKEIVKEILEIMIPWVHTGLIGVLNMKQIDIIIMKRDSLNMREKEVLAKERWHRTILMSSTNPQETKDIIEMNIVMVARIVTGAMVTKNIENKDPGCIAMI